MPDNALQYWEFLSYIVTVIGLPFAIFVVWLDKRQQMKNDEEEVFLQLSDDYAKFLELVLSNPDLRLMGSSKPSLTDEQVERRNILFDILIALFERAYILVYEEHMSPETARLWQTWEDYMGSWCRRQDFRDMLPVLLDGEDQAFQRHIKSVAERTKICN